MRPPTVLLFLPLGFLGCPSGGDKDQDTAPVDDTADTSTIDTDAVDRGTGDITGTVTVNLYQTDTDGEIVDLTWEEYGEDFPFGAIFVAAYTVDETTNEITYHDEYVISAPSTTGDPYSLSIDLNDAETVYVYAALDWWPDGVLGTDEPLGIYGDPIAVIEGSAVNDVDIVINAALLPGGGGGGTYVELTGDIEIAEAYTGGGAMVMLYDTAGQGPYYTASVTPSATADGAEGAFSLWVGADFGPARLLGAWDDDQNGLIDPTDSWGGYAIAGETGNPITVGAADASGYSVLIPFGIPPTITPFVRLEGALLFDDGFETLPAGAVVYVTALRTLPGTDFSVADLESGYDWASFTGAELTGVSLDYLMVTPSSAITYLHAYIDLDGDSVLNEVGEPVGSYGRTGRLSTGTTTQSGLDLRLLTVLE